LGYWATTLGKYPITHELTPDRIDSRIGIGVYLNNRHLTRLKFIYKIKSYQKIHPWYDLRNIYKKLEHPSIS